MSYFLHDPDSGPLDYSVDFTSWLSSGDTVSTVSWSVSPSGPTLSSPSLSGAVATTKVTGGTLGDVYRLTARATSANGLIDDRSMELRTGQQ